MLSDTTRAFLADVIGRPPRDEALWLEALTHGSTGHDRNYERLEFLGDRVLGLSIAEWLHETGRDSEGKLSQRLNALVSRATCAQIARRIGLGAHMQLGKQARDDGGHDSDNILGDVMEALLGASFVEQGFDATRAMVRRFSIPDTRRIASAGRAASDCGPIGPDTGEGHWTKCPIACALQQS